MLLSMITSLPLGIGVKGTANTTTFINSLKVNLGLSLVGVISGEFLVSKAGLRISNCLWRAGIPTRFSNDECNNTSVQWQQCFIEA